MKHVPGDEDTNIRKRHVNREVICECAEQAMARGTSPAELMCHKSEEESNNYVVDYSQYGACACCYDVTTQQEVKESRVKGSSQEIK